MPKLLLRFVAGLLALSVLTCAIIGAVFPSPAYSATTPDAGQACTYLDAVGATRSCAGVSTDSRACRLGVAITPSDSTDLTTAVRAIYAPVAGTIAVYFVDDSVGTSVTITSAATQWHPIWVRRVLATGTTATGLIGCTK